MSTKKSTLLLMVALVFFGMVQSQVFAQMGVIQGEIKDDKGKPVPEAEITIQDMKLKREFKIKTDDDGKFVHAGVPLNGIYRVIVRKQGYQGNYVEGIRPGMSISDKTGFVEMQLDPGAERKMAFELSDEELAEFKKDEEQIKKEREAFEASKASFDQGIALYQAGQYQEAAVAFQKAAEKNAAEPVIWANLGQAYAKLSRKEEAIEAYSKAIALDPETPAYFQNRGGIYADLGKSEEAQADYDKAASLSVNLDPKEAAVSYYNMGVTHINNGKNDEAIAALRKAVELNPQYEDAQYQLGIVLLSVDLGEATKALKRYLEIAPNGRYAEDVKAILASL